jgi:hypothetical protein
MRFLRKGIPKRHERRVPIENKKKSHLSVGVFFLWFLFFAALIYITFFSVFFLVSVTQIIGANEVSEETLREFAEKQLDGKYFNIFSKRNFFLMRPRTLETQLLEEFPLLSSAVVTRVFSDGLHIEVAERKKIILWCFGKRCFLADEGGVARNGERALSQENISHAIFITDMSGKSVTLGEKVFDPDYGKFVVQLNDSFQEQLGIPLEPRFTTISRFANEVRAKTSEGWEVYFGTDVPLQSSLDALKLLFAKELPKELRGKLAYVDLRTENRAYYAFRAEEKVENPETVSSPVSQVKASDTESKKKKKK